MLLKYITVNCNEDDHLQKFENKNSKCLCRFYAILDPWLVSCYCTPGNHKRKYEKQRENKTKIPDNLKYE